MKTQRLEYLANQDPADSTFAEVAAMARELLQHRGTHDANGDRIEPAATITPETFTPSRLRATPTEQPPTSSATS